MESINPAVLIAALYVFVLAAFLGYQVISRVPPLLHTPLMSATNAISGISLIGSLVLAGTHKVNFHALASGGDVAKPSVATILGFIAVTTATINVVGGFGITDRMLKMFQQRKGAKGESK
jgi:H+-translocating NAD(P) transhydrogenase subunit alpha